MKTFRTAAGLLLFGALIIATSVDMSATPRYGVDVVHSFAGGAADGALSSAGLVQATDGNFYGTTASGGASNAGTVFKMTPSGAVTIMHSFTGGGDGSSPFAALIQATDGNFYGTAYSGGAAGLGTVFMITPAGAFTTLYSFTGGTDGANPRAAVIQVSNGNLYGTTQFGGSANRGTLFAMSLTGVVLGRYTFTGGFDGAYPYAPLIQAADGSMYGTNYGGTVSTFGRIFRLANGSVSVVHTFASGAADGANPTTALVQANDGNFYGTTRFGGASNKGTAFKMTPDGTVTVLNSFTGGFDGQNPDGALLQAADGNLYGTTTVGALGYGTAYKVTLAGNLTVVHTFTGGAEGSVPSAPLMQATSGRLYGTATFGGASSFGLVFRLPASTAGDFDGNGTADITVFRPSTGTWYVRSSSNVTASYVWGASGDIPVPGDYDGDGKIDIAVFRPSNGTWYIRFSSTGTFVALVWGGGSDVPVPGDYDGDGISDIAVFRPSTGTWYIRYTTTGTFSSFVWGGGGDVPVPGDYDGDGLTDLAVFRPSTSTWYIRFTATGTFIAQAWGTSGDVPVAADYDGDGKTDIAVFRPSNGTWYVVNSSTMTYTVVGWGLGSDIPVPGDYDGDGLVDIAVFRPSNGTWYIRYSGSSTIAAIVWGGAGDTPILGQ